MLKLRTVNNRTARYLGKGINLYGKTFLKELKSLTDYTPSEIGQSIIHYSIMDILYYRAKKINTVQLYLFLTIDKKGAFDAQKNIYINKTLGNQRFCNFLAYVRNHGSYVDDYWCDQSLHTIVMKFPIKKAYQHFLHSEYSQMYSISELREIGLNPIIHINGEKYKSADYIILTHAKEHGKTILKQVVYENYGVEDIAEEPDEFDIPWSIREEVYNNAYMSENEREQIINMKKKKDYVLYN